jgi:hypothetical protein
MRFFKNVHCICLLTSSMQCIVLYAGCCWRGAFTLLAGLYAGGATFAGAGS